MPALPRLPNLQARRLFMGAQGLLEDPGRRADLGALKRVLGRLGFVQLDSIPVVARAHDLILRTRLHGYRPEHLVRLLEKERFLFEGWTHDASAILAAHYPQWKPRFREDAARLRAQAWWQHHFRGTAPEAVLAHVRQRITEEGPLMSRDFDHPEKRGPWWGWKPQKAALDFLWRTGELAIRGRVNFHKIYDLAGRVHPEGHGAPEPDAETHRDWACRSAAEGLVLFTSRELAAHWAAVDLAEAGAWCTREAEHGRLAKVEVEQADGSLQPAWALADWEARIRRLPEPPRGLRLLAPFDPLVRDRTRLQRRFGFDYRFEAFVPENKRQYGYYVLPIMDGDRFVGRADLKFHRDEGRLEVRGLWWEPGVRPRKANLAEALEALACWCLRDI